MTIFEKLIKSGVDCDICGKPMYPLYGCGLENDMLVCTDIECGAEIVFPTSTKVPGQDDINEY